MAISVQCVSASLTEGNPSIATLGLGHTYLRDMSVVNWSFSVKWSGASKVTSVCAEIGVSNSQGQQLGWLLGKEEKTTATSGTRNYSGTLFVPQLGTMYGPGITSLADGTYTFEFSFVVWNGNSGDGAVGSPYYTVTYTTLKAPAVTTFDVYRANYYGTKQDDGTYLRYSVAASVNKLVASDTGTFTLRHRQSGTSTWTNINLGSGVASVNVSGAQIAGSFPISTSYECELVIADRYQTVANAKMIPTASVLMHFKADKSGIGVGKYAETTNLLDVALPTKFGAGVAFGKSADSGTILDVNYPARFRSSVTMDAPLPIGQGGTGASSVAGAMNNLDLRAGVLQSVSINKSGLNSFNITFSPPRATVPTAVLATIYGSTVSNIQYWAFSSGNFSTSGCTIYGYRTTQESGTGTISLQWIAI